MVSTAWRSVVPDMVAHRNGLKRVAPLHPAAIAKHLRKCSSGEQKLLCLAVVGGFLSNVATAVFLPGAEPSCKLCGNTNMLCPPHPLSTNIGKLGSGE